MQCISQINFGFYGTAHLHLSYPTFRPKWEVGVNELGEG